MGGLERAPQAPRRSGHPGKAVAPLEILVVEAHMIELKGKRVLVIGERDGVNGPAIEACVRSAGAQVLYAETLCFV